MQNEEVKVAILSVRPSAFIILPSALSVPHGSLRLARFSEADTIQRVQQ